MTVYMYVKIRISAAPAHARTRTRAHRPAAPRQSSGVSQTPHPTACPQAGIPHRPPSWYIVALVCVIEQRKGGGGEQQKKTFRTCTQLNMNIQQRDTGGTGGCAAKKC